MTAPKKRAALQLSVQVSEQPSHRSDCREGKLEEEAWWEAEGLESCSVPAHKSNIPRRR